MFKKLTEAKKKTDLYVIYLAIINLLESKSCIENVVSVKKEQQNTMEKQHRNT